MDEWIQNKGYLFDEIRNNRILRTHQMIIVHRFYVALENNSKIKSCKVPFIKSFFKVNFVGFI
jgi:hypothetical protein